MNTGMIGLGAMGAHMARNMARAGFLTTIWNRTPTKAIELAEELDVSYAASLEELAEAVDIIFICVSADDDVLSVVEGLLPGLQTGSIVVDMSTVSSETAKKAAASLSDRGVSFLDAPVSGGVEGAKDGALAAMIGGEEETLKRARPILESMASRIVYIGEVGSGQGAKAVNQLMAAGINQAVTEALALGEALSLPMDKVIEVISGGAAGNWFLEHRGATMIDGIFTPGFKLALHHKDLKICQQMAAQAGIESDLIEMTLHHYDMLMVDGYGEEDISALYRLKRHSDAH